MVYKAYVTRSTLFFVDMKLYIQFVQPFSQAALNTEVFILSHNYKLMEIHMMFTEVDTLNVDNLLCPISQDGLIFRP